MSLEPTTREQREKLAVLGFVRVDGLKTDNGRMIEPRVTELGRFDMNNGMAAIVTEGGEVWISVSVWPGSATARCVYESAAGEHGKLIKELCPNGTGVYVPCSNGEILKQREILCRLASPDWKPRQ